VVDSEVTAAARATSGRMSYHQMAEDVLAIMDREKLKTAALLGWSDGAATALDLALSHPERVSRLVLFATNYDLSGIAIRWRPARHLQGVLRALRSRLPKAEPQT